MCNSVPVPGPSWPLEGGLSPRLLYTQVSVYDVTRDTKTKIQEQSSNNVQSCHQAARILYKSIRLGKCVYHAIHQTAEATKFTIIIFLVQACLRAPPVVADVAKLAIVFT